MDPLLGDDAMCDMCNERIVFGGSYWMHIGTATPRHPAIPRLGTHDTLHVDGPIQAREVGECMACGAGAGEFGMRGSVRVFTFRLGIFRARLCLNCLKRLGQHIQTTLIGR